jgi:hypothetical protein
MKRLQWIVVLLLAASPAWAAKKITVQELKDLLIARQHANKTDADVATELHDVELTEELTRATMNSFAPFTLGQLTTEQLFVLEARSAMLTPPATDLPATAAPDAAAQKAILDKAVDYATKTFAQLPTVTGTKDARRFQDGAETTPGSLGSHSAATVATAISPIRYTAGTEVQVTLKNGAEQAPAEKDKTQWGANGMIALLGQSPALSTVLEDAQASGKISWVRWETVNGHPAAVYSFSVDKKKTHYAVNYCCFPDSDQAGAIGMRGQTQNGGQGNYGVNTTWKPYKATLPYHGEIFVNPDSGVVVRLITEAEFKSSELVRQEDQRIDYGPAKVGDQTLMLPERSIINTLALPFGDSGQARFITRHTIFTTDYKNYQSGGS